MHHPSQQEAPMHDHSWKFLRTRGGVGETLRGGIEGFLYGTLQLS